MGMPYHDRPGPVAYFRWDEGHSRVRTTYILWHRIDTYSKHARSEDDTQLANYELLKFFFGRSHSRGVFRFILFTTSLGLHSNCGDKTVGNKVKIERMCSAVPKGFI